MDSINMRFYTPVTTGKPILNGTGISTTPQTAGAVTGQKSFADILQQQCGRESEVSFSKHALKRVQQKNISMSESAFARLNEGIRLAGEKQLAEALIMVDNLAFVVNAKNQTVITAMKSGEQASVFTNIQGAVIV